VWQLIQVTPVAGAGALSTAVTCVWPQPTQPNNLLVAFVGNFQGVGDQTVSGGTWQFMTATGTASQTHAAVQSRYAAGNDANPTLASNAALGYVACAAEFGWGVADVDSLGSVAATGATSYAVNLDGTNQSGRIPNTSNAARFAGGLLLGAATAQYSSAQTIAPTFSSPLVSALTEYNNNSTSIQYHANFVWGLIDTEATGSPNALNTSGLAASSTAACAAICVLFPLPARTLQPHGNPSGV